MDFQIRAKLPIEDVNRMELPMDIGPDFIIEVETHGAEAKGIPTSGTLNLEIMQLFL